MSEVFSPYEKMPKSLKKVGKNDRSKAEGLKWVVTEKVHGANFSFVYRNNGRLRFARRRGYLSWDESFFGFQKVVQRLEGNIYRLFEDLSAKVVFPSDVLATYTVYGELYGGAYPHPNVSPIKGLGAIQTGVYYSADIQFIAFDIAVECFGRKYYLDYVTAMHYFKAHGIPFAEPLFVGSLSEALDFNTKINSTIPGKHNLPPLKDNLIEGVVLKPYSGNEEFLKRPILKIKNREFLENEQQYNGATKWCFDLNVSCMTEETLTVAKGMRRLLNFNRMESAISKVGALADDNAAEIKQELWNDILEDYNENSKTSYSQLTEVQQDWVKERIQAEINIFIVATVAKNR